MATTTYSSLSDELMPLLRKKCLAHAEPIMCLGKFGMTKPMPKNKANVVKFQTLFLWRWLPLL